MPRVDTPDNVPAEHVRLYQVLSENLDSFREANDDRTGTLSTPRLGGHVLAADSNLGPQLLVPGWMSGVELTLDRMRDLGFESITLAIGYPLFVEDWVPEAAAYVEFYRRVAAAVRARDMELGVEQIVLFDASPFSPFQLGLRSAGLDRERFASEHANMAQTIIDELTPDYLTLLHEPRTFAELTAVPEVGTPAGATAFLTDVLGSLRPGETSIGAGTVNHDDFQFAEEFCNLSLDYFDVHFYATNPASVANAYALAEKAQHCGFEFRMTEAWLFKSTGDDGAEQANLEGWEIGFRLDVFSFFEPLDIRFHKEVLRFAERSGATLLTPFWTNYYFAHVDYDETTAGLSYAELVGVEAPRRVGDAVAAGRHTALGRAYSELLGTRFAR